MLPVMIFRFAVRLAAAAVPRLVAAGQLFGELGRSWKPSRMPCTYPPVFWRVDSPVSWPRVKSGLVSHRTVARRVPARRWLAETGTQPSCPSTDDELPVVAAPANQAVITAKVAADPPNTSQRQQRRRAIPRANVDRLRATVSHIGPTFNLFKCPMSPRGRRPAMPGR